MAKKYRDEAINLMIIDFQNQMRQLQIEVLFFSILMVLGFTGLGLAFISQLISGGNYVS
jgi:hypothetical protein